MHSVIKHKQTSDPLLSFRQYRSKEGNVNKTRRDYRQYKKEYKANQGGSNAPLGGTDAEGPSNFSKFATGAIDTVSGLTTSLNTTNSAEALSVRNGMTSALMSSGNPYAMAAGAALKIVDSIGDATGLHMDDIDKGAAKDAGVSKSETTINNMLNAIPGVGLFAGMFTDKTTEDVNSLDQYGEDVISGYAGIKKNLDSAKKLAGKRLWFGGAQANELIDDTNKKMDLINQIGYTNSLVKNSDYGKDIAQQNLNRYAGSNYQMHAIGKNGMKIPSKSELQQVLALRRLEKGGIIGTDSNILPEGALHARLNHLQDTNPELEDTTKKGIPILDESGQQVAEIECDELIFRLEVTKKIEELMKDGSDEAAIEAGKLLAEELITNTHDNCGSLTEEGENGKK